MRPFLVDGIGAILRIFAKASLFEIFLKLFPNRDKQTTGALTELWVLLNLALSIMFLILISKNSPIRIVAIIYALMRITEVIVFLFYTQIYGGYRGKKKPRLHYTVLSFRRIIIITIILYFEVIVWFAGLYRINGEHFVFSNLPGLDNILKALYYSVVTMTTIGYGDVSAKTTIGYVLVIAQSIIAVFMTLLILSRIISYLPRPRTLDKIEELPIED